MVQKICTSVWGSYPLFPVNINSKELYFCEYIYVFISSCLRGNLIQNIWPRSRFYIICKKNTSKCFVGLFTIFNPLPSLTTCTSTVKWYVHVYWSVWNKNIDGCSLRYEVVKIWFPCSDVCVLFFKFLIVSTLKFSEDLWELLMKERKREREITPVNN